MAKLNGHEVAGLQGVIDGVPQAFADERARGTAGTGRIHQLYLVLVKDGRSLRGPAPHAVIVLVGILHRRVARKEDHRLSAEAIHIPDGLLGNLHEFQECLQLRIATIHNTHIGTIGVQLSTKL